MYTITAQLLSLEEAGERFGDIVDLDAGQKTNEEGSLVGLERWLQSPHEPDSTPICALFVNVPGVDRATLRSVASCELWHINVDSENLLRQQSFVVLGPQDGGLYVPLWNSRALAMHGNVRTIRLVLVGNECVLDVCHDLTGMDLEDYLLGCQSVMASSGPHYNPSRTHSEDRLAEVTERSNEIAVSGRVVHLLDAR